MKKDKETTQAQDKTKAKKDKATSDGGKDKNLGGLTASELKADSGKTGRSGGKGA
jgi:hypothetical protein